MGILLLCHPIPLKGLKHLQVSPVLSMRQINENSPTTIYGDYADMKLNLTLFAIILALMVALTLSWAVPISEAFEPRDYQGGHIEPWTLERGIEYLEWAKGNHEYWAEHADKCNETSGSAEFNYKVMTEYDQLINWLKEER